MKLGDLVKMKRGYSPVGIVVETKHTNLGRWVRIMWPDSSYPNMERQSDVEVISESR